MSELRRWTDLSKLAPLKTHDYEIVDLHEKGNYLLLPPQERSLRQVVCGPAKN